MNYVDLDVDLFGLELETPTSRYKKLITIKNTTRTYGQWADKCSGELLIISLFNRTYFVQVEKLSSNVTDKYVYI